MKLVWKISISVIIIIVCTIITTTLRSSLKVSDWYEYPFFFIQAAVLASIVIFVGLLFTNILASWSKKKLLISWIVTYLVLLFGWWIDEFILR